MSRHLIRWSLCAGLALNAVVATVRSMPINRNAVVARHNPAIRSVDPLAPLTVGNGHFAFTVDATGLQSFGAFYYANGLPLETLARWCWTSEANPDVHSLADVMRDYVRADGTSVSLPSRGSLSASGWLRRNPRLHPLGQVALVWDKPDGAAFVPEDMKEVAQKLDLWSGAITSRYRLGGHAVELVTICDPETDTIAIKLRSSLWATGKLSLRLSFPRGHDPSIKNTPSFDWSAPEEHHSALVDGGNAVQREVSGTRYSVVSNVALVPDEEPHRFSIVGNRDGETEVLELVLRFSAEGDDLPKELLSFAAIEARAAAHWTAFWRKGAAVDFTGSTHPLAHEFERRLVLSRYLTTVQSVSAIPPQESGLTANTWYGKHHTEMVWWHIAHFIAWGRADMAEVSFGWFLKTLPEAQQLAAERGLRGARWAKMVGPEGRESPGGNPLIVWNQPHPIYLAELLYRSSPECEKCEMLARYAELVSETADCLASMLVWDGATDRYVLGPPLWIAQEIHDQAQSQNPAFELAYWRWALETAQTWREREGKARNLDWDERLARLSDLPVVDGKYVALESHPDTWERRASRHDHPSMLMPLGFLPGGPDVDRTTMERTFDAVLGDWDWETKIWGWDYPMIAMTAARLGRTEEAVEMLLRDGPNNRYLPNGHVPQRSDRVGGNAAASRGYEIAAYLPANGAFLSAAALLLFGWEGAEGPFPMLSKEDGWEVRTEGGMVSP